MRTKVIELRFDPMDNNDYDTFSGAKLDSLICYMGNVVFIMQPDGTILITETSGKVEKGEGWMYWDLLTTP